MKPAFAADDITLISFTGAHYSFYSHDDILFSYFSPPRIYFPPSPSADPDSRHQAADYHYRWHRYKCRTRAQTKRAARVAEPSADITILDTDAFLAFRMLLRRLDYLHFDEAKMTPAIFPRAAPLRAFAILARRACSRSA